MVNRSIVQAAMIQTKNAAFIMFLVRIFFSLLLKIKLFKLFNLFRDFLRNFILQMLDYTFYNGLATSVTFSVLF